MSRASTSISPIGLALADWLPRAGWSPPQLARAIAHRDGRGCATGTEAAIQNLLRGRTAPHWQRQRIRAFLAAWPDPAVCVAWAEEIEFAASRRIQEQEDALLARRAAVEEERRVRKALLIAAEHPGPRGRPRPAPPLPAEIAGLECLDAATIRALSGGTIGKVELLRAAGARA